MDDETRLTRRAQLEGIVSAAAILGLAGCTDRLPVERPGREERNDSAGNDDDSAGADDAASRADDAVDTAHADPDEAERAIGRATSAINHGLVELAVVEDYLEDPDGVAFEPGEAGAHFDDAEEYLASAEATDDGTFADDIEIRRALLEAGWAVTAAFEDMVADDRVVGLEQLLSDFVERNFDDVATAAADMEEIFASVNADIQPVFEEHLEGVEFAVLELDPPELAVEGFDALVRSFEGSEALAATLGATVDAWRPFEAGTAAYRSHDFAAAELAFDDAMDGFAHVVDIAAEWTNADLPIDPEWAAVYCHADRMESAAGAFGAATGAMQDEDVATGAEKESEAEEYVAAAMDCV